MKKDLKTDIAEVVRGYLKQSGFDSFFGGSYRFGYESKSSDVDLFVNSNANSKESILKVMEETFYLMFSTPIHYTNGRAYGNGLILQLQISGLIHINFYNPDAYFKISMEHAIVEDFINKNPILKKMRRSASSGSAFYKEIKKMIKEETNGI